MGTPAASPPTERPPAPVVVAARVAAGAQPVCPHLRLGHDPVKSSGPANFCHADERDGSLSHRGVRRLVRGRPRAREPQAVGLAYQAAICLTREHLGCALYVASAMRRPPAPATVSEHAPLEVVDVEVFTELVRTIPGVATDGDSTAAGPGAEGDAVGSARGGKGQAAE